MPKVKPLGESAKLKARWKEANASFDRQIAWLCVVSRMSGSEVAEHIGVARGTLARWRKDCSCMTIGAERKLIALFENYGIPYDRMLGEKKEAHT